MPFSSIFSGGTGDACWVTNTVTPTAATTSTLATLCSWTCNTPACSGTDCANDIVWVRLGLTKQTTAATATTTPTFWPYGQARWIEHERQPSDQELYERAVAEHNEQEAERWRRVIAQRERITAERQQAERAETERREVAKQRAKELLLEHLTPEQRETFNKNGWFVVEGGKTKTKYRIRAGGSLVANIDVFDNVDTDRRTHRLCGHVPTHQIPLGDHLLAQKMMLEFAEDDFLRIANRHPV